MTKLHNGAGPHDKPWPVDDRLDPSLLETGDGRNVIEKYRYWTVEAIKADLDKTRQPLEVAIENVSRDFNMGTMIRNANAFNISRVHIIGSKQWNKRGAMKTDVYMNIEYHTDAESFMHIMRKRQKTVLAMDIVKGSQPLAGVVLPRSAVMVFGAEGPGLSKELLDFADQVIHIEQLGSTRSVNVGVASGIAMYTWLQQHALN